MLRLFKRFLTPFFGLVIAACIFTFLQVIAELQLPNIMSSIVDIGIYNADVNYVISKGIEMMLWALLSLVCVVLAALCAARAAMGFGRDVRQALFESVQQYSLFEFNAFGTSTLITRNTNDVQQLERFVQMLMTMAIMTPAMFIGAIVMAFSTNAEMASLIFVVMPLLIILVFLFLHKGMPLLRSLQQRIDNVNRIMRENLQGVRVVRAYNKESYERRRFGKANRSLAETYVKVGRLIGALMPLMMFILNATIVALYFFGANAVDKGSLSAGSIMALVQYITLILMSLMMLSMVFALMPRTLAASERIAEVIDTKSCIRDGLLTELASLPSSPVFEMRNATFRFERADKPAVQDISFALKPQTTTVLIGPTGSGKSTIVNMMLRLYDATEGSICLRGTNIKDLSLKTLRTHISFVPQKSVLFSGTIAENLRFGAPSATDEELWQALRWVKAADFISSYDEGLSYNIAQGGENLSGGQRQRIAIARALLRDVDLYIFDDSFSALDFKTDALVRSAISEVLANKTVFIVTQRASVALGADQVLLLSDEGELIARGTHDELLDISDEYCSLVESQFGVEETSLKTKLVGGK